MLQYIAAKRVQHREDKIKIIKVPWKGICGVYTVKKVSGIAGMSLTKLSLSGNN
jgi:hypothetical protein